MNIPIKSILFRHKLLLILISFFTVIQIIINSVYPYITKFIIDDVLIYRDLDQLKTILILIVMLIAIQLPINVGASHFCAKWTQLIILDLRMIIGEIFLNYKDNSKKNGLFINILASDCELVGTQLLSLTVNSLPNALLIIVYIGLMIRLSKFLTIIALGAIPLFLIVSYITSNKVFHLTKELQRYRDVLVEFLNGYVRNKILIDLYGLKEEEKTNLLNIADQTKDINVKTNTIVSLLNNILGMIATVTPLVTLFVGSILVIDDQLSLGAVIAFNTYSTLLFTPITKLLTLPPIYSQMKASIERIRQCDFSAVENIEGVYMKSEDLNKNLVVVDNLIPYVEHRALFKRGLNFSIKEGEILQVKGRNGSGKSILLKSLINYHQSFSGCIKVRSNINLVYVPQDNFLFGGTIRDNLTKGLKDFDSAYLKDLILLFRLNVPLDQLVTPFSLSLSSGQMQKIKLIRSLLCKPDLLLLDEVLANLDRQTMYVLIEYLKKIKLATVVVYHGETGNLLSTFIENILTLEEM